MQPLQAFKIDIVYFKVLHTYGDKQINIPIGFKNIEELEAKVKAFSYRVKKEDCLDLPPKTYKTNSAFNRRTKSSVW